MLVYSDYLGHVLPYERQGHDQADMPFVTWAPAGGFRLLDGGSDMAQLT